jgi:hypothetical protein
MGEQQKSGSQNLVLEAEKALVSPKQRISVPDSPPDSVALATRAQDTPALEEALQKTWEMLLVLLVRPALMQDYPSGIQALTKMARLPSDSEPTILQRILPAVEI